ncbi:MAG: glycosyl hydrolase [Dongiaceae bacterium]
MIRGFLGAALAAALASGGLAAAPSAQAADLGVYKGAGPTGASGVPKFESWVGRKVPRALDFFSMYTWTDLLSTAIWSAKAWSPANGKTWKMTFAIPMLPNDGVSTLAKGATGQYNATFGQIADALIRNGHADAILRIGWEFNGGWYPWYAGKCTSCYAQYFQQIVTTMRARPGAAFKFDWNPALGYLGFPAEKAYPGDDYVDVIGMDTYNEYWGTDYKTVTPETRWANLMNQDHGLAWHKRFAVAHNKPMSFPEWGTGIRPDGHGGGDDPYFIQQMYSWIVGANVLYHNYWDYPASDYNGQLSNNSKPNAGAMFQQLFGPGNTTTSSTTTTTTTTTTTPTTPPAPSTTPGASTTPTTTVTTPTTAPTPTTQPGGRRRKNG